MYVVRTTEPGFLFIFSGFLTLPTAYVTGNPVECVLHPKLWNKTRVWDPLGLGHIHQDEYEEENVGYPVGTVRKMSANEVAQALQCNEYKREKLDACKFVSMLENLDTKK